MRPSFLEKFLLILATGMMLLMCIGCGTQPEGKIPVTTSSKEALSDFMEGRDLFERLRGQESLQHFENAISKDPDFAMAYLFSSFRIQLTKIALLVFHSCYCGLAKTKCAICAMASPTVPKGRSAWAKTIFFLHQPSINEPI